MDLVPSDKALGLATPIWDEYSKIINSEDRHTGGRKVRIDKKYDHIEISLYSIQYIIGYSRIDQFIHGCHMWKVAIEMVERFAFYERAKRSFAVIATGLAIIF
jgi:hypothetical protein